MSAALSKASSVRKVYPSDANFILVAVADALGTYNYLMNQGIIVRDRSKVTLCEGCLRITVGTIEENNQIINLLENYSG